MRFTQPLLLVAFVMLPWILTRGKRARLSRPVIVLRLATFAALVLAAAGSSIWFGSGGAAVVFLLDHSASVPAREAIAALAKASAHTERMRAEDSAAVVLFGAEAVVDQPLAHRALGRDITSRVSAGATNLEAAIRVARTMLPREGAARIVLMSDGRETIGDAVAEAWLASAGGITLDVMPLGRTRAAATVIELRGPASVRVGEPFSLTAILHGAAGSSADVAFAQGEKSIGTQRATVDRTNTAAVAVEQRIAAPGPVTYTAAASGSGIVNAEAGAVVLATAQPAVLYVSGGETPLRGILDPAAYRLDVASPQELPASTDRLAAFDAIVLDDVAADELSERQSRALVEYVERAGGGVLLRGNERTLEPSGFTRTAIDAILPVDLRRRSGSRAPDLALAVVFDKSGSMDDAVGDVTKIELARRAVAAVQEVLPAGDSLGVIAFDGSPTVVAPLAAGHNADDLRSRLRGISANGPTAIAPAVRMAYDWLRSSRAARRQILLLSDGRTNAEDAAQLLTLAATPDVTLSVVATGTDVDRELFRDVAARGRGAVFFPDDVRKLPDILAREAARASGGWRVRETFVVRNPSTHPVMTGIDSGTLPSLGGYVASALRPAAEAPLQSHLGDPVLAVWRRGLGRVAVFTGDMAPSFQRWPAYARLWRQTVRWIGRAETASTLAAHLDTRASGATLVIDAVDEHGRFLNNYSGRGVVTTPSGEQRAIEIRHSAPGQYEASFDLHQSGPYVVAADLRNALVGAAEMTLRRGFYWLPAAEQPGAGADMARLQEIAAAGGGKILADGESPFDRPRTPAYRDVTTVLAALALVLFIADVAIRRGVTLGAIRQWRRRVESREAPAA